MASDQTANLITEAGSKLDPNENANSLINLISGLENHLGSSPLITAKTAIREEFETYL